MSDFLSPGPLILRLRIDDHLSYLGVLVFCLDSVPYPPNPRSLPPEAPFQHRSHDLPILGIEAGREEYRREDDRGNYTAKP